MFPKFISPVILVALLSACAAPQTPPSRSTPVGLPAGEGLGVRETSTPTSAVIFPTETLAPTSTPTETSTPTPEPTATPEPTVIQKEITFEVTRASGEVIPFSIPAFIPNIPEGATPEQIADIEKQVLAEAFEFIVNDNVDWGNVMAKTLSHYTKEEQQYFDDVWLIPGLGEIYSGRAIVTIEPTGGLIPAANNTIGLSVRNLTYNEINGTLFKYVTGDDEVIGNEIFVGVNVNTVVPLIKFQTITLDLNN